MTSAISHSAGLRLSRRAGAGPNNNAHIKRIGRLAFWLAMSGLSMSLACFCLFFKVTLAHFDMGVDSSSGSYWLVNMFTFSMLRISVSYSQIQAIRISSRKQAGCISWKCFSHTVNAATTHWAVPVSPDASQSQASNSSNNSGTSGSSSTSQSFDRSSFNLLPSPILATLDENVAYVGDFQDPTRRRSIETTRRTYAPSSGLLGGHSRPSIIPNDITSNTWENASGDSERRHSS